MKQNYLMEITLQYNTLTILIIYFAMTNVAIYGLGGETIDLFSQYRAILAGASGSLMHLGIGPIVTGSIIMQLFTGAKIINLNLQDPRDKEIYQGTQKVLVLVMIVVESAPQVFGFLEPSSAIVADVGLGRAIGNCYRLQLECRFWQGQDYRWDISAG